MRSVLAFALGLASLVLQAGCAHVSSNADGTRQITGWVSITLPPASSAPTAADWIRLRTFGLAYSRTDLGTNIDVGYSDNTLAVMRGNSCIIFDPILASLLNQKGD
jgi:hypothetical protein